MSETGVCVGVGDAWAQAANSIMAACSQTTPNTPRGRILSSIIDEVTLSFDAADGQTGDKIALQEEEQQDDRHAHQD